MKNIWEVELLNGAARETELSQPNSELLYISAARQSCGAKLMRREGNNPDRQLRSLNVC